MRARLADGGDGGHLEALDALGDGGVGGAVAEGDLFADLEAGRAGDRHVGRAGGDGDDRTVGEGLPQRGGAPAAVPMAAILRVSTLEPVSMVMVSPTDMPAVLRTWMVVSPARAGTARPELERPRR